MKLTIIIIFISKTINTCRQEFDPYIETVGESKNICASPSLIMNKYEDSSIAEELLLFDNVYYNTKICVE